MVPEDCDDPCESIPLNPKRKRERFLTDAEFTRLHPYRRRALRTRGGQQLWGSIALPRHGQPGLSHPMSIATNQCL